MATYSHFLAIINGLQRQVDLSANTLQVLEIEINSILLSSSASGAAGSTLIGDDNSYSHFTPTAATIKGALAGIDAQLGSAGSGSVTSVALLDGSTSPIYNISGSPVTTSGTLDFTLKTQNANLIFAGPGTGAAAQPTFRALVAADIPSLSSTYANTTLSNLGTTSINANLLPAAASTQVLGSNSLPWSSIWVNEILAPGQIDFQLTNGKLFNSSGSFVADFTNNLLSDNTQFVSVDWQNRVLKDSAGASQLSWTTAGAAITNALLFPGSTSGVVSVIAPATITPYSLTLPAAVAAGNGYVLTSDTSGVLSWAPTAAAGVTSVAFADGSTTPIFAVSGSPVTSTGTLEITLETQSAALVFAGPVSGSAAQPSFRALAATDIPDISATYVTQSEVGAASGVASLDGSGKVPAAQLPSVVMEYQEAWDPSTNTPTLADGASTNGFVYRVSVAFAGPIGGLSDPSMVNFNIGDLVIYSGTLAAFQKAPAVDGVSSVNGAVGAVTVNAINQLTGDVTAGPASGSASAAATIAAGAVTASKLATVTDGVTLDQSGSGSTLEVKAAGISATQLSTGAFDQLTITGGAGTPAAVSSSPNLTISITAGQNFTANTSYAVRWGIVANSENQGQVYAADPDTSSFDEFYVIGVALSTAGVTAGNPISIVKAGLYSLGSADTAFASGTQGMPVFLDSAGAMTATAPTTAGLAVTRVGMIVDTNIIDIFPVAVGVN